MRISLILRRFLATALAMAAASGVCAAGMPSRATPEAPPEPGRFVAPALPALESIELAAPKVKSAPHVDERGRLRVADVRSLPKSRSITRWARIDDRFVTRIEASSPEAEGLRVRIELEAIDAPLEIRVQGAGGRVESMRLEAGFRGEAWTPWTQGAQQAIELASEALPAGAVRIGAVLHFVASPFAKMAGACTVATHCPTGDAVLDAAIAERKKSVVRVNFVEGGGGFICSGTLINTERFPAGFVLTANHCISTVAAASSVSTLWFYENASCTDATVSPGSVQLAGGAELVFANYSADATLLRTNLPPPAGAVYSGWDPQRLFPGEAVVSLSHPRGDTGRYATGTVTQEYRINNLPQDQYGVRFNRGIIEGGSSGSGLFTLSGGSLVLRATLTGSTVFNGPGGMTCTNVQEDALYGRFEILAPQIAPYIGLAGRAPDDAPNRFLDWAAFATDIGGITTPIDLLGTPLALGDRRIDYVGDVDVYRFRLSRPAVVSAWSEGGLDTIGYFLDAEGLAIEEASSDDAQMRDTNFGVTWFLQPGTYYLVVAPWDAHATGAYGLRMRADVMDGANYTDLWWQPAEPGWGINLNHQGHILFATLFAYDVDGSQMWLVMPRGERQPDGSFAGELLRTAGPVFNASPWTGAASSPVGSMRLAFLGTNSATLTYTVNGTEVTKPITRQEFAKRPACRWSIFDRTYARNLQDLWWNPGEPGWGVNFTHQGDIIFATLFTYDQGGRSLWLVMPAGRRAGAATYSGTLYRTTGAPFNAPWAPNTNVEVGTMTVTFTNGNTGNLTYSVGGVSVFKSIQRQVFSSPATECES